MAFIGLENGDRGGDYGSCYSRGALVIFIRVYGKGGRESDGRKGEGRGNPIDWKRRGAY